MDKIRNALFFVLIVNVVIATTNSWAIGSRIVVGVNAAVLLVLIVIKLIHRG